MPLAIDHLVYATPDLDSSVAELGRRLGVTAMPGGRHVGRGTHNALLHLGGRTYLEIIGPDPSQALAPGTPMPFGLEERTEAGLVWFAVACPNLAIVVDRLRRGGFEAGDSFDMQRARPDGVLLRWQLSSRPQIPEGGTEPFLIDWLDSPHPALDTPRGVTLRRLDLHHPDPDRVRRYLSLLSDDPDPGPEVMVSAAGTAGLMAQLDTPNGTVELV
ncbi:MAG: VOC family protein [Acidimicrobiales bacterium]